MSEKKEEQPKPVLAATEDELLKNDLPIYNEAFVGGLRVVDASKTDLLSATATWAIKTLIVQGQGLCLIDPHGDLYHRLLDFCALSSHSNANVNA